MFKSVFAKYVAAFVLVILLSFAVILATVSSIIVAYSESAKTEIMQTAARSSAVFLEGMIKDNGTQGVEETVAQRQDGVCEVLCSICSGSDDITVYVADTNGKILLRAGKTENRPQINETIPAFVSDRLLSDGAGVEGVKDSDFLTDTPTACAFPIYNSANESCGFVMVCAESMLISELLDVIVKAIVISILWVLLAALIAVYFVSDRVISPLKEIGRAAKEFAAGKFDTRVAVKGNDEVAQLAVAFNNMAESLDNYDTMRNTFMSNVSHDLRSPMTSISGFIDGILDGVIPPEKHTYYLQIVSAEIKRLSRLVATLLDLSRIQAGERKFTMAPFDVCEMAREILISFEKKIDEKGLCVEFNCDEDRMSAVADRDAIYQILYNLCDNAVKFSSEGGVLSISILKLKGRKLLVSVYNEGQGIADADIPYVFDRFYKSDKSRGLNKTGVGLGLFISKTIIDAHGEKIWVESDYGEDCCFHFTLQGE